MIVPDHFDSVTLRRVADRHVNRFERRIHAACLGNRNVRVNECEMYLAIWQDIRDSVQRWDGPLFPIANLKPNEFAEVTDAYVSGEFEE